MVRKHRRFRFGLVAVIVLTAVGLMAPPALAQDGSNEIEIIGVLRRLGGNVAMVNTLPFDLSRATLQPGLRFGDQVTVHATLSPDGTWVVREVEPLAPGAVSGATDDALPRQGEFEIAGTLTDQGQGFMVVSGQRIDTRSAEIHGTPVIGAVVRAHVSVIDGIWVAREVHTALDDGLGAGDDDDHQGDNAGRGGNDDPAGDDNGVNRTGSDDGPGDDNGGQHDGGDDNSGSGHDDRGGDDDHGGDDGGGNSGRGGHDDAGDDHGGDD